MYLSPTTLYFLKLSLWRIAIAAICIQICEQLVYFSLILNLSIFFASVIKFKKSA